MEMFYLSLFLVSVTTIALRLYAILPRPTKRVSAITKEGDKATCSLSVFLGSGGHTSELLAMISGLDFHRYQPRIYYVSEGDTLSANKAIALEKSKASAGGSTQVHETSSPSSATAFVPERSSSTSESEDVLPYTIVVIPRARRVHQSLLTTPATALVSLFWCQYHVSLSSVFRPKTNPSKPTRDEATSVLILNGPGTCLTLCLAVYVNKFFALPSPVIIYIESFARVKSLSLSGKLIRPLVDRFIVQWPQLLQDVKMAEYHGWLV
ncbi:hypothetical protein D9611_003823 [Ephemerocybe angulata]|uniref:UDP-N-acetylglucosamine transferase subunit ALG14 n=1 Tax=Ephemerocybe angulata TaxID=980116 RepID=A0A8H5B5L5_9AGAR|nr:hypothetical protein D9611_003823 [Tulosesus angulatus]